MGDLAYYYKNKEYYKEKFKAYYRANKKHLLDISKAYYKKDPARHRFNQIKALYGLDKEEFLAMESRQNGKCAICDQYPLKKGLHVDHDHKTGKVRGLLCSKCNLALGIFDTVEKAAKIIEYLGGYRDPIS